jgi:TonB-dependent receptor
MQKKLEKRSSRRLNITRFAFGTASLMGLVAQALAQQATPDAKESITVTGYRASIESSTKDKRNATGFVDSIFAEDMGKFPDSNIAESINRIPGILITRDITGEGVNIQIRGLGTSFTKILLNQAPIAVASTGPSDAQNTNREVDLDLLPTDLFTKLSVYKSPTAAMTEGGAAGVVDMRTAHPYDRPGMNVAINIQGVDNSVANKNGNRGSVLASNTWGNTFGILGGIAWGRDKIKTTGFESVGWTNPNLSATQSTSANRNATGGGNWTIPGTVPANAGNGLTPGQTIDQAFLLAHNPGLTIDQIDNAIIPRLGRVMYEEGTKDRTSGVISMEWNPNADLHFYLDLLDAKKKNNFNRADMNWVGRNGAAIPLNMQVDRTDCSNGCVVTQATYANAQWFLEFRPYTEDLTLWSANPGFTYNISKDLKADGMLYETKSKFTRTSPTVLPITVGSSGVTVNYTNGEIPVITTNIDLNNPANFQWNGGRVNLQEEKRETETKGGRLNFTFNGWKPFTLTTGLAYDDISRTINAYDNTGPWQAAACGNNPSVWLPSPNGSPPCNGANTPGASAAALYPGYGTGYTAGQGSPSQLTYGGSLVPNNVLPTYLSPGPGGFITIDWQRFQNATHYGDYLAAAPQVGSSNTGASAGFVEEKATSAYAMIDGKGNLGEMPWKYNAGFRFVHTDQTVGGFQSNADPRNATLTNGGLYPNANAFVYFKTSYNETLPSATAAINLTKDLVFRSSASRTMTRPDPNALRPGLNFSSPSADIGTVGNTELKPYLSDNIDLGLEWYTGGSGYVSATPFFKRIKGFTQNSNITAPFSALAPYGVTYATLSPTQQAAIDSRGGPAQANVVLTEQVNAQGYLSIRGTELGWVQPLDRWLPWPGLGFQANWTRIHQSTTGGVSGAVALGVPENAYNFTAYYEDHGIMLRLAQTYAQGSQISTPNQNGITNAALFQDSYTQVDFSSAFDLAEIMDYTGHYKQYWPTITFDIINLNKGKRRQYFQFSNATYSEYAPGSTTLLGLRMKF